MQKHLKIATSSGPMHPDSASEIVLAGVRPERELVLIFDQLCAYYLDKAMEAGRKILAAATKYPPMLIEHVRSVFSKVAEAAKTAVMPPSSKCEQFRIVLQKILAAKMPVKVFITFSKGDVPTMKLLKPDSIFKFVPKDNERLMEVMANADWGNNPLAYRATVVILNKLQVSQFAEILSKKGVTDLKIIERSTSHN